MYLCHQPLAFIKLFEAGAIWPPLQTKKLQKQLIENNKKTYKTISAEAQVKGFVEPPVMTFAMEENSTILV